MAILSQILPILLLILAGVALRLFRVLTDEIVEGLKKLVVTLVLPSVLFTVFLDVEFDASYWGLFILVAAICIGLYLLGRGLRRLVAPQRPYFPFLFTGFEYGMLGMSLFGAAYGMDAIRYIAIVDLAHELFIWFFFAPLLMILRDGDSRPSAVLRQFVTSPVVIGLVSGIVLGALGFADTIKTAPVLSSLYVAMTHLATMIVPLILIIVGYGIRIRREGLGEVLAFVGLRYALIVPAALILNHLVVGGWLGLAAPFQIAFFVLMILPPPFIIPVFMQRAGEAERAYVNNALAVSTIVSLTLFTGYLALHPTL